MGSLRAVRVALAGSAVVASMLLAAPAHAEPAVSVSPSSGLTDGQTVTVTASGFTAGTTRSVVQCAAQVAGQDDCNVAGVKFINIGADGSGSIEFAVVAGDSVFPSGKGCTADSPCLITVAEPVAQPTESAGAQITFAAAGGSDTGGTTGDSEQMPETGSETLLLATLAIALLAGGAGALRVARSRR